MIPPSQSPWVIEPLGQSSLLRVVEPLYTCLQVYFFSLLLLDPEIKVSDTVVRKFPHADANIPVPFSILNISLVTSIVLTAGSCLLAMPLMLPGISRACL